MNTVPIQEFKFQNYDGPLIVEDAPEHATLTCKNHTFLRWTSKNPYQRSLHYLGHQQYVDYIEGKTKEIHIPEGEQKYAFQECSCPFSELVVIVDE